MARSTRLFLIRHGETVDNVAQIFAGSRDSALTNHGYVQAQRLGAHLNALGLRFTHIYSSHLQRAAKTAGVIRDAQTRRSDRGIPNVVQLPVLMERDFGNLEGKRWEQMPPEVKTSNKGQSLGKHKSVAGFVDVESKDSMARRADMFLDEHFLPLLDTQSESSEHVIAIVSHGLMLSVLRKRLLLRLPYDSISFSPDLAVNPHVSLEHLGAWSNTGYMDLHMKFATKEPCTVEGVVSHSVAEQSTLQDDTPVVKVEMRHSNAQRVTQNGTDSGISEHKDASLQCTALIAPALPPKLVQSWTTVIQAINGKDHLIGLKRSRGVGSAKHDASQKSIDSYLNKQTTC